MSHQVADEKFMMSERKNKQKLYVGMREIQLSHWCWLRAVFLLGIKYNTGGTGNMLINVVQRNAFLMAKRLSAQTRKLGAWAHHLRKPWASFY